MTWYCTRRLSGAEKKRIITLYGNGHSLREISEELGRRKSTIYDITRKEYGRKIPLLKLDATPTAALGEILGLFAADGCFYIDRKRYHYTLSIDLWTTKKSTRESLLV